jgi:hypothetical protein
MLWLYILTHDVRQDYDKYYKTVIPNLIGNLILTRKKAIPDASGMTA